jgi:hypothetical protein
MILPSVLLENLRDDPALMELLGGSLAEERLPNGKLDTRLEAWLVAEGFLKSPEIRHYLTYLFDLYESYWNIAKYFPRDNPGKERGREFGTIATSPLEMLHIARYLYYLKSQGMVGDVLECGCFKGYSSCCLSLACQRLGLRLIVADSFHGLPAAMTDDEESYYKVGDFCGSLDEVRQNVETFGAIDAVEFLPGWFEDSLKGFDRKLCLLWLDVDLYQSARDVLDQVYPELVSGGVIFSHEFQPQSIDAEGRVASSSRSVTKAFSDFLSENMLQHQAKYLCGFTGIVVPGATEPLSISTSRLVALLKANESLNLARPPLLEIDDYEAAENCVGYLDGVVDGVVRGWAWNRSSPSRSVTVDFFTGTEFLGSAEADIHRPDLTVLGFGDCGFEFTLPRPEIGDREIQAFFHETAYPLSQSAPQAVSDG